MLPKKPKPREASNYYSKDDEIDKMNQGVSSTPQTYEPFRPEPVTQQVKTIPETQKATPKVDDVKEVKSYLEQPVVMDSVAETIAKEPSMRDKLYKDLQEKYSSQNRQKMVDENNEGGIDWGAGLAGLGAAIAGRDALQAGLSIRDRNQKDRENKLVNFDKTKDQLKQDIDNTDLEDKRVREQDPNSEESKMAKQLALQMGYKGDPSTITAEKFKSFGPYQQKIYEIQEKSLDRKEARDERRFQAGVKFNERKEAREDKQKELSTSQAKQRGLYESGITAEKQYNEAIKDKGNYDPTSSGQWIDNSSWAPNLLKNNKAIEAQAAQSAWVESFLRDASGAAIPKDERTEYAKDFFPQAGDSEQVVQNKNELRRQKMENARISSGAETGHGDFNSKDTNGKTVRVSNGKETLEIQESDLKDAIKDGYKRI